MTHRGQLIAFVVLAAAVLGISLLQFSNSVKAPFARKGPPPKTVSEQQAEILAAQKTTDTDSDGLSDFDELNLYFTSPYLDDTDSDGYKDGDEIKTNHDPNCPSGKICGSSSADAQSAAPPQIVAPDLAPQDETFIGGGAAVFQGFDAATIRSLLRGAGVPQDALDAIDDATLEQLYRQTLASSSPEIREFAATTTPE